MTSLGGTTIRLAILVGLVLLTISAGGYSARAQDWVVKSGISQRVQYNTNLLLTPNDEVNTFGSVTTPYVTVERDGPNSRMTLDGKFKFAEYLDHSELDSQDQLVNFSGTKDVSDRSTLGLTAAFIRDTTLESEQDISGRFLDESVRFTRWQADPSWTYWLSPVDKMTLSGDYQTVFYASDLKTDYQYYGGSVQWEHQLSEVAAVLASASYFRFDPDDILDTKTDIYGGLVGYRYTPSERLSLTGQVGLDYDATHQDDIGSGTGDSDDFGYRVKFDFDYEVSEQTKAKLLLSHDTEPSGDGRQVTRNRANVILSYQVSDLTTLSFNAGYLDDQDYFGSSTGSNAADSQSRYYSVSPTVTFKITDDLNLDASYQFRYKTTEADNESANDNMAFLTLRYALPDQHWSGF
jgi:hypothetical protein